MQRHRARGFEIYIEVEEAFERIGPPAIQRRRGFAEAVLSLDEFAGVPVHTANVGDEAIDQAGFDRTGPKNPPVFDHVLQVVALIRRDITRRP